MRWAIVAAVVIVPPVAILVLGLCKAAAIGDQYEWDNPAICPGCDGFIEFDDEGSNICLSCGVTRRWTP